MRSSYIVRLSILSVSIFAAAAVSIIGSLLTVLVVEVEEAGEVVDEIDRIMNVGGGEVGSCYTDHYFFEF